MHDVPPVPPVGEAPASLFDGGHLWVQEFVEGAPLRVQLRDSGLLVFGDLNSAFDGDVPPGYRHAVRHVREQFDRDPLRAALDDVTALTLSGVVTHGSGVPYDRESLPPFLLVDAWADSEDGLLPPDAVDRLATQVGLASLPAVRKEVRAVDFDVEALDFPQSVWRDGPAAGVLVRNKTGDRASIANTAVETTVPATADTSEQSPAALAAELVTDRRIERARVSADGVPDSDVLTERVVELVAHEAHDALLGDRARVDIEAVRSEAGALVREHLDEHSG